MNFWQTLKKPIMVLAPLADVTDPAFRRIIAKYGKPDVLWTEFVSADGLFLSPVGEYCEKFLKDEISVEELKETYTRGVPGSHLIRDLEYSELERPIVAQFFTSKPALMRKAAHLAAKLGFDGIDINMGCPDKSIEKQGAGAGLIKSPVLAQEIIRAAKEGAGGLPVSVKTRIGYNKNELETWVPNLLEANPAIITIHARTRKEMSNVPAQWEHVRRAVEIRDEKVPRTGVLDISSLSVGHTRIGVLGTSSLDGRSHTTPSCGTLIFGNGDVKDLDDARKRVEETGCDGVMLGRAIFGNPWLFANLSHAERDGQIERPAKLLAKQDISIPERLRVMVEHTNLYAELLPHKSFAIMKKHYKAYVTGWDGAKELRMKLMEAQTAGEVEKIVTDYLTGAVL